MDEPMMLDANAVAGDLAELFGSDMTVTIHRCVHCGNVGQMGTLLAWTQGPGITLRCCICRDVVVRIVRTPSRTLIDVSGAAYLEIRTA
ncbi:MAG: DUF6510 family protein [Chloroflexota bacterium]